MSDGTAEGTGLFEGAGWYLADRAGRVRRCALLPGVRQQPRADRLRAVERARTAPWGMPRRVADIAPGTASSNPVGLVASPHGLLFGADPSQSYGSWLWRYDGQKRSRWGTSHSAIPPVSGTTSTSTERPLRTSTADSTRRMAQPRGTSLVEERAGSPLGSLNGAPIFRTSAWDATVSRNRSFLKTTLGVPQGSVTLLEIEDSTGAVFGGGVELDGRYVFGIDRDGDQTREPGTLGHGRNGGRHAAPEGHPHRGAGEQPLARGFSHRRRPDPDLLLRLRGPILVPALADRWERPPRPSLSHLVTSLYYPSDLTALRGPDLLPRGVLEDALLDRRQWHPRRRRRRPAGVLRGAVTTRRGRPLPLLRPSQNGLWRVDALGVVAHVWSGSVGNLTAVGDELYFVAARTANQSVFRTNGKRRHRPPRAGRSNLYTNPYELTPVQTPAGTRVFFRAYGFGPGGSAQGTGQELWATDGTVEGTRLVRDVNAHESLEYPGYPGSSLPLAADRRGEHALLHGVGAGARPRALEERRHRRGDRPRQGHHRRHGDRPDLRAIRGDVSSASSCRSVESSSSPPGARSPASSSGRPTGRARERPWSATSYRAPAPPIQPT